MNRNSYRNSDEDKLIHVFRSIEQRFQHLKKLYMKINFQYSYDTLSIDKRFMALGDMIIAKRETLQELELYFGENRCDPTDNQIIALVKQIGSNLKALQSLKLEFCEWRDVNSYKHRMAMMNPNITQKDLYDYPNSYKSVIAVLNEILPNITTLKDLYVNFENKVKIFNKSAIPNLPKKPYDELIRNWSLNRVHRENNMRLNDVDSNMNKKPPVLRSDLCIEFFYHQTTDQMVLGFFESVGPNIRSLQSIKIDFSGYMRIKSKTLITISNRIIPLLTGLRDITLDLAMCKNIESAAIEELSNLLGIHTKELQRIHLDLTGCQQITDKAIDALSQQIQSNLPALHTMILKLSKCSRISDEAIKALSRVIPKVNKLHLVAADCPLISDESILSLCGVPIQRCEAYYQLENMSLNYQQVLQHASALHLILTNQIRENFDNLYACNFREDNTLIPQELMGEVYWRLESDRMGLECLYFNLEKSKERMLEFRGDMLSNVDFRMNKMVSLLLDFRDCKKITDLSMLALRQQIFNFENIQSLSLNFRGCQARVQYYRYTPELSRYTVDWENDKERKNLELAEERGKEILRPEDEIDSIERRLLELIKEEYKREFETK